MTNIDLLNADGIDESVINDTRFSKCCGCDGYSNAIACNPTMFYFGLCPKVNTASHSFNGYSSVDGGDGDEDDVEYENEEAEVGGVESADLPRFRTLVRNKKLSFKATYGKGHFKWGNWDNKKLTPNTPRWISGWRRKWRDFKHSGGLAQLKQQAKGLAPVTTTTPVPVTTTPAPVQVTSDGVPLNDVVGGRGAGKNAIRPTTVELEKPTTSTSPTGEKGDSSEGVSSDRILGMSPTVFYIALGVVVLVGGFITYKVIKAKGLKK